MTPNNTFDRSAKRRRRLVPVAHARRRPVNVSVGHNHMEAIVASSKGRTAWLVAAGVLISLCTLAATLFAFAPPRPPAGYAPAILGIGMFFVSMALVGYLAQPRSPRLVRIGTTLGVALAESVAFALLLLFLRLNIFGA